MRRNVVVSVLLVMVALTGCQAVSIWPSARSDPGNSGFNAGERKLGVGTFWALNERYRIPLGQVDSAWSAPTVANGLVYVGVHDGLEAFSADGTTGCSATTSTCSPVWTADIGDRGMLGAPTVAGGTVFVSTFPRTAPAQLFAFDAAGVTNCSGTPRVCAPLWTAPVGGAPPVTVRNGLVYVADLTSVYALDAAGIRGCAGSPKVCSPLWSTAPQTPDQFGGLAAPTVSATSLYMMDYRGVVHVYDATGHDGCSGVPVTCASRWSTPHHVDGVATLGWTAPVLEGSRLLTYTDVSLVAHPDAPVVSSFDANGVQGCSGSPVVCAPQWSTSLPGTAMNTQLAVANGTIYVVHRTGSGTGTISAIGADGAGCAGSPMTCPVKWSSSGNSYAGDWLFPVVANGVVYQSGPSGISAFDSQAPSSRCSGPAGSVLCQDAGGIGTYTGNLSIADGRMYVLSTSGINSNPITATLAIYA